MSRLLLTANYLSHISRYVRYCIVTYLTHTMLLRQSRRQRVSTTDSTRAETSMFTFLCRPFERFTSVVLQCLMLYVWLFAQNLIFYVFQTILCTIFVNREEKFKISENNVLQCQISDNLALFIINRNGISNEKIRFILKTIETQYTCGHENIGTLLKSE